MHSNQKNRIIIINGEEGNIEASFKNLEIKLDLNYSRDVISYNFEKVKTCHNGSDILFLRSVFDLIEKNNNQDILYEEAILSTKTCIMLNECNEKQKIIIL